MPFISSPKTNKMFGGDDAEALRRELKVVNDMWSTMFALLDHRANRADQERIEIRKRLNKVCRESDRLKREMINRER